MEFHSGLPPASVLQPPRILCTYSIYRHFGLQSHEVLQARRHRGVSALASEDDDDNDAIFQNVSTPCPWSRMELRWMKEETRAYVTSTSNLNVWQPTQEGCIEAICHIETWCSNRLQVHHYVMDPSFPF